MKVKNTARDILGFPLSIREAIQRGMGILTRGDVKASRLDSEILLASVMGWGMEQIYLNYETQLEREKSILFQSLLYRRAQGEPIAYITGHKEFWSLDFLVNSSVLVPRPETEGVVELALDLMTVATQQRFHLLDVGTGSGAIAVSLAKERGNVEIWATDCSVAALRVAQLNAERNRVSDRIHFFYGDLFSPVRELKGFFHGIIANPPYIKSNDLLALAQEIRWEPELALDGGPDGLNFYSPIIELSPYYLVLGGFMVLEIGMEMGKDVCRIMKKIGCYTEGKVHKDYAGRDRVVSAQITHRPDALCQGE